MKDVGSHNLGWLSLVHSDLACAVDARPGCSGPSSLGAQWLLGVAIQVIDVERVPWLRSESASSLALRSDSVHLVSQFVEIRLEST